MIPPEHMGNFTDKDFKFLRWCDLGASMFSTCAKAKYMAVIVSPEGRVVGAGYNGSAPGQDHCDQGGCPRLRDGSPSGSSYDNCVSVHAEANALIYTDWSPRQRGTLYVNGTPCYGCSKLIAGAGLARVVYVPDSRYADWPRCEKLLYESGLYLVPGPSPATFVGSW